VIRDEIQPDPGTGMDIRSATLLLARVADPNPKEFVTSGWNFHNTALRKQEKWISPQSVPLRNLFQYVILRRTSIVRAEKLNTYRFCDNVWTFMLKDVEFREHAEINKVDRVKIGKDTFRNLPTFWSSFLEFQRN
jgi:Transcription initiation factor IIA, gamma subunit